MIGKYFGYDCNAIKTKLVVKPEHLERAKELFKGTGITIVEGHRNLGGLVGSQEFKEEAASEKVSEWVAQVQLLSEIAQTQPHAAMAAFTHSLQHQWTHFMRTTGGLSENLAPLEQAIRNDFIPALLEVESITDKERVIFALPARHGGLGLSNPMRDARGRHNDSKTLTKVLQEKIMSQHPHLDFDADEHNAKVRAIRKRWEQIHTNRRIEVSRDDEELQHILAFACEKGASNVFSVIPLEKYGFAIKSKRDFRDLICLRYRKPVKGLPTLCVCGQDYSLDHSQTCPRGGFIYMRHDQPKEAFARMAKGCFFDVETEPVLQPLSGEQLRLRSAIRSDDARSDVRVRGFYTNMKNAFFEFRIFYPFARSYSDKTPAQLYHQMEQMRKREYEERIRGIEDGDFIPMIMSSSGGMGTQMTRAVKHLASKIALKTGEKHGKVMNVIRCELAFTLARAALVCLRGSRAIYPTRATYNPVENIALASNEARI